MTAIKSVNLFLHRGTAPVLYVDRDETMAPKHCLNNNLVRIVGLAPDTRLAAVRAIHTSEHPSFPFVMCGVGSNKVARPNTLVTSVADVTRLNPVQCLRRIQAAHSSLTST